MTDGKRAIIQQLFQEYDIESTSDIQDALKDLLGGTIKEMMETEMDSHLGYEKSQRSANENARNGYKSKTLNSSYGSVRIEVPQDFDYWGEITPKALINDGAHKLQKAGILPPYEWSADINTDVDLRE